MSAGEVFDGQLPVVSHPVKAPDKVGETAILGIDQAMQGDLNAGCLSQMHGQGLVLREMRIDGVLRLDDVACASVTQAEGLLCDIENRAQLGLDALHRDLSGPQDRLLSLLFGAVGKILQVPQTGRQEAEARLAVAAFGAFSQRDWTAIHAVAASMVTAPTVSLPTAINCAKASVRSILF